RLARPRATTEARHLAATPAGRVLIGACAAIALATVVGLVALWPHAEHRHGPTQALGGTTQAATITAVRDVRCPGPTPQRCRQIVVTVEGHASPITLGPVAASPMVSTGEKIRVAPDSAPGTKSVAGAERYSFVGVDRHGSLLWMGALLGLLALILLWWRGLLAALGVGLSVAILTTFLVPAILQGRPALLVALTAALAVMFTTLVLTSGLGAQTLAAILGISATLLLTCALASAGVALAHLDGRSNELSLFLSQQDGALSLRGVVLAGMIIGALGVLADTAVTQASAVMALRRADHRLSAPRLYRGAFVVGRDHLSATIHTLVLAYAGAALPLLLVMRSSAVSTTDALNSQDIAEPIVATIVGCMALIAAVPLTTALASLLVSRLPAELMPDGHGHYD
ncbi:MAG: YibE/F family protein, partial [Actinomycetota bacterium]|nr:YibE/F family protein [Actinomycetota bacterium]